MTSYGNYNGTAQGTVLKSRHTQYTDTAPADGLKRLKRDLDHQAKRRAAARIAAQEEFKTANKRVIAEAFHEGTKAVDTEYDDINLEEHTFPVGILVVSLIVTIVAVFFLMNCSSVIECTNSINRYKEEIAAYNAERAELEIIRDRNVNLPELESYAISKGMVKSEKLTSRYVNMNDSSKVERSENREEIYSISTIMSGVAKTLQEALG